MGFSPLDVLKTGASKLKINPLSALSLASEYQYRRKVMKAAKDKGLNEEDLKKFTGKQHRKLFEQVARTLGVDVPSEQDLTDNRKAAALKMAQSLAGKFDIGNQESQGIIDSLMRAAEESNDASPQEFLHNMAGAAEQLAPGGGAILHQIADRFASSEQLDQAVEKELADVKL